MLPLLDLRGVPEHVRQVADDDRAARLVRSDGGAPADDHQGEHDLIQPDAGDEAAVVRSAHTEPSEWNDTGERAVVR
jgi:hypothetical protein